jgi:hypothetical protein
MDNKEGSNSLSDQSASLIDKVNNYLHTSLDLIKLRVIQKLAEVVSGLIARLLIFLLLIMFSLFVNVGIALFIGKLLNGYFWGFIIMSLFYLLIAVILYQFRHRLIHKTIGSSIIEQLLDQVNVEDIIQGNEEKNEK